MEGITPELVEAFGKLTLDVATAFGAIMATVISVFTAYYTFKRTGRNERDIHIAHDRIREVKGEPLQHRDHPEFRAAYKEQVKKP